MSTTIYQLPVDDSRSSVIELADGGRRYRKQLVKFGKWVNPNGNGDPLILDRAWAERALTNFKNKVINKIPVVVGHPKTSAELLVGTRGWTHAMSIEDGGIWGEFGTDAETAKKIDDGLYDDVSISFDPNYQVKDSGEMVGPVILHVGIVNDPYLKGMQPFQALSESANVIMLSESKEYEVSNVTIKNEREFAVTVKFDVDGAEQTVTIEPGTEAEVPETAAEAVKTQVTEAVKPETDEEKTAREAAEAKAASDKEAADKAAADKVIADKAAADAKVLTAEEQLEAANKELSEMKLKEAERSSTDAYTVALSEGKICPAQEASFKKLHTASQSTLVTLSDGAQESLSGVLAEFLKAAPKAINFSEQGASGDEGKDKSPWEKLSDEEREANRNMQISEQEFNENSPENSNNGSGSGQNKEK